MLGGVLVLSGGADRLATSLTSIGEPNYCALNCAIFLDRPMTDIAA